MQPESLQGNLDFRLMCMAFVIRDWVHPPIRILREAGLQSGMTVLDFGCGPGGFSFSAAKLAGPSGLVYAVDNHPLALKFLRRCMHKKKLKNIRVISGADMAKIPQDCVDLVLLYDVLHDLSEPHAVLTEWQRVLKPNGVLSVRDHHLKETPLLSAITGGGLFRCEGIERGTFRFMKVGTREVAF